MLLAKANMVFFSLRGQLLNVREASAKQITDNAEINNIKKILGLKQGEKYDKDDSIKLLRYGHLMIMADQVENLLDSPFQYYSFYLFCLVQNIFSPPQSVHQV